MTDRPSMESLIETEDVGIESFHPGGLEITRELAELCGVGKDTFVLDVASGTGESACFLADELAARVIGIDMSDHLLRKAREKAAGRALSIEFLKGDAQQLPFADGTFDVVISECTLCLLDKARALDEMFRVARPGGFVGIHDVCWKPNTPQLLKQRLSELEGESPETLSDWELLFERAGLIDVHAVDKSQLMSAWVDDIKKRLGLVRELAIFLRVLRLWGLAGLSSVLQSERLFRSSHVGYGIIVGAKPLRP